MTEQEKAKKLGSIVKVTFTKTTAKVVSKFGVAVEKTGSLKIADREKFAKKLIRENIAGAEFQGVEVKAGKTSDVFYFTAPKGWRG